jgi:hypothetical protein
MGTSPGASTAGIFLAAFALVLTGCGKSGNGTDSDAQANSLSGVADAESTELEDLFRDSMDFDVSDVRNGSTNCTDIVDRADVPALITKWPVELKSFLTGVLKKFPSQAMIKAALHGIYLVPNSALYDEQTKSTSAGLACDRGSDYKGLIFLNYDSVIRKRSRGQVDQWQNSTSVTGQYLTTVEGDAAAVTLMHEVFHTIDNKLFVHGTNDALQRRQSFLGQSWVGDKPRYERGSILALNDTASEGRELRRCRHTQSTGTMLTGAMEDAESMAEELRNLAENTNFIVPYTMASPSEDFAESLTVYYFGTYYRSWQKRTVAFEKKTLFVHDTERILDTKQQHKTKVCAAATMIFGNCRLGN